MWGLCCWIQIWRRVHDIVLFLVGRRFRTSAYDPDPDPLDPQDFGFLDPDPDPQKYADPWILIQGVKYQPKTSAKKNRFTPKTQIWTFEKKERL